MSAVREGARRAGRLPRRLARRVRRFVRSGPPSHRGLRAAGVVALGAGVLVGVVLTVWVGGRTVVTAVALEQAQGDLRHFAYQLSASQTPSSTALQRAVEGRTDLAASTAGDPVWRAAEHLPLVGPNLQSLRQTSQVLDRLVRSAGPVAKAAEGLSLKSLRPSTGIDLGPLQRMPKPYAAFDDAVGRAAAQAKDIRTAGTIGPLRDQVVELRSTLTSARPISTEVRKVLPLAYSILGGYSRRYYLLMFQNNAEERASGGNPAAIALLKVYKGKLTLDRQLNSSEFPHPFAKAVRSYGAEYDRIYGDHVGTYITNTTFTPDFPTTASLTRTMWQKVTGGTVDGVISFDPVALSYLLKATGPITLKGGDVIDSKNAVSYLLSDVYALHPNVKVQNQIFSSAAASIFSAVTRGQGGLTKYLAQVPRMVQEQRLKAWSVRDSEETLLLDSPLGTMLPADNTGKTVLGVYNNDDATSKMSYYMDDTVSVAARRCSATTPRYTVTTTVTNTLTPAKAKTVSDFVLAHQANIPFGGDRQWVQLYGPVGSKLIGVSVGKKKVVWGTDISAARNTNPDATGAGIRRPAVKGTLYGRPVGTVSITIPMGKTVTVRGVFAGGTALSTHVGVSHTPRVRAVPVTVASVPCD
jgi:hypothetical protein